MKLWYKKFVRMVLVLFCLIDINFVFAFHTKAGSPQAQINYEESLFSLSEEQEQELLDAAEQKMKQAKVECDRIWSMKKKTELKKLKKKDNKIIDKLIDRIDKIKYQIDKEADLCGRKDKTLEQQVFCKAKISRLYERIHKLEDQRYRAENTVNSGGGLTRQAVQTKYQEAREAYERLYRAFKNNAARRACPEQDMTDPVNRSKAYF